MLIIILFATYFTAINIFGIIIVHLQKKDKELLIEEQAQTKKLILASVAENAENINDVAILNGVKVEKHESFDTSNEADSNNKKESDKQENIKSSAKDKKKKKDKKEKQSTATPKAPIRDSKIIITAFLGGALGVYIGLLTNKYKLRNIFFMVFVPVLIALNIYLFVMALTTDWMGIFY